MISNFPSTEILSVQLLDESIHSSWTDEDEQSIQEEYQRLSSDISRIRAETNNLDLHIQEMARNLQSANREVFLTFQKIQEEFLQLVNEHNRKTQEELERQHKEQEKNSPTEKTEEKLDDSKVERVSNSRISSRESRRLISTLYKKIALKTHPDRTNDAELIAIFFLAKEAHDNEELEFLKEIWDGLKNGRKKFSRLRLKIKSIREEWNIAMNMRISLMNSIDYQMLRSYRVEEQRPHVISFHRQNLVKMTQDLKRKIHQLDPSRYPPMPQYMTTVTYYTNINTNWNS